MSKKGAIFNNALTLFFAKGFDNTSIADIAELSKLTKAGIYYYYPSKQDLLFDILDYAAEALFLNLKSSIGSIKNENDFEHIVHSLVTGCIEALWKNKMLFKVSLYEKDKLDSPRAEIIKTKNRKNVNFLKNNLGKIVKRLHKVNISEELLTALAFSIIGVSAYLYYWYNPAGTLSLDEIKRFYSKLIYKGVFSL